MLFILLALASHPVQASDFSNDDSANGCRAGFSNASLKRVDIASGIQDEVKPGDTLGSIEILIAIADTKNYNKAPDQEKIYFRASLPEGAENKDALKALATQIIKGQFKSLCIKAKDDWAALDQSLNLKYGTNPNTYIVDAKQPAPRE